MQENFSSHSLAEIFRDLYLAERSGVLHLSRGGVEKRIYFDRGMILYAESSSDDEDLGRRLVGEGKISAGALAEARRNISESKDLAQALVNRGLIGKEALSHTVRFIVERIVQTVFKWEGGSARFNEGWLLQEIFESDILSTFEVILKGIAGMVGFEPIRDALRGLDSRLKARVPAPLPMERLALSPAHGFILSRVDGTSSLSDILSILPQGEEDLACRFLYGLLVMGVVAHDPPLGEGPFQITAILRDHADNIALETVQEKEISKTYESLKQVGPHQILAVSATATREEIEAAYRAAKDRFSRERVLPRVRERLRSELAVIDSRLVEAYLTLCQARAADPIARKEDAHDGGQKPPLGADDFLVRVEMDKTRAKRVIEESAKTADAYYAKARKFVREADFHNAIQYAKLAISYAPEDSRYYFLMAECQVRNPDARWQRMAEQSYLKATELDPWNADYRVSLGRLYKRRGLKLRARKQFEQALETVPYHEAATKELESLR
jgi:tetratricopeptide (TPR) repeat protein